ncbi:MAG: hypothetical protein EOP85_16770, partial [Verrucomicrobiaceae bacterium]
MKPNRAVNPSLATFSGKKLLTGIALLAACHLPVQAQTQVDARQPVIARVQIVYSVVGHYCDMYDRIAHLNNRGVPPGNSNYIVPHLVYEPIVTLYNPYNTELVLPRSRVRIANPPVGFKFKKNADYLRTDWKEGGPFHGLGRFSLNSVSSASATKTFTLLLTEGDSNTFGGSIVLQPGQCKVF